MRSSSARAASHDDLVDLRDPAASQPPQGGFVIEGAGLPASRPHIAIIVIHKKIIVERSVPDVPCASIISISKRFSYAYHMPFAYRRPSD